jgi:hypothetical protein
VIPSSRGQDEKQCGHQNYLDLDNEIYRAHIEREHVHTPHDPSHLEPLDGNDKKKGKHRLGVEDSVVAKTGAP